MKGGMPNELLVTSNGIFEYIRICKCQFELKFYVWPQKWIMIFEGFFFFFRYASLFTKSHRNISRDTK